MQRQDVLRSWDVPAFVELLEALVLARRYRRLSDQQLELLEAGEQLPAGTTWGAYPYIRVMQTVTAGFARFGMTPADRGRLIAADVVGTGAGVGSGGSAAPASDILSS